MMYTPMEIKVVRANARRLKMTASSQFWKMPPRELAKICNGYGPDRWPDKLRKLITWIFRHYPEGAMIHDVGYQYSTGKEADWKAEDLRMYNNNKSKHKDLYGRFWYLSPAGCWSRFKIWGAYRALQKHGWEAWMDAHKRLEDAGCVK